MFSRTMINTYNVILFYFASSIKFFHSRLKINNIHFLAWLFRRYCYSFGVVIVVVVQELSHFVTYHLLKTQSMCLLSKVQSILSRETIQNAFFFFQNYASFFFDLDFLSSMKHPTAERWHRHAVLLLTIYLRQQACKKH